MAKDTMSADTMPPPAPEPVGEAAQGEASEARPRRRRWLTGCAAVLTFVAGLGAAWGKDLAGMRTSTCASPGWRSLVERVHIPLSAQRDFGPLSCPESTWTATNVEMA